MTRWSAEPAYRRIAAEWAEAIDDGTVADGQQLPTRQKLMQEHGMSLQVVRGALDLLHHEGYLRAEAAKGTFVYRPPRLTLPMYTFEDEDRLVDAFTAVVERQEHRPKQDIEVHVLRPPVSIARSLRLGDDELALVRRRIRYVEVSRTRSPTPTILRSWSRARSWPNRRTSRPAFATCSPSSATRWSTTTTASPPADRTNGSSSSCHCLRVCR